MARGNPSEALDRISDKSFHPGLLRPEFRDKPHECPQPYQAARAAEGGLAVAGRHRLEHDPQEWTPVFGKDHGPKIT
jgi:hypothetical protein